MLIIRLTVRWTLIDTLTIKVPFYQVSFVYAIRRPSGTSVTIRISNRRDLVNMFSVINNERHVDKFKLLPSLISRKTGSYIGDFVRV